MAAVAVFLSGMYSPRIIRCGEVRLFASLLRSVALTHPTPCRHGCRDIPARYIPSLSVCLGASLIICFSLRSVLVLRRILALVCDHSHSQLWSH